MQDMGRKTAAAAAALWAAVWWDSQAHIMLRHEQVLSKHCSMVVTGLRNIRLACWPCARQPVGGGKVILLFWGGVGSDVKLCWRSLYEEEQMMEENGGGPEWFGWKPVGGGKRRPQGEL